MKLRADYSECFESVCIMKNNKTEFEATLTNYLKRGFRLCSSSCNSNTWKAILVLDFDCFEDDFE